MPIALDANLSSTPTYSTGAGTTVVIVTSAAAAVGSKMFLAVSYFDNLGVVSAFDVVAGASGYAWSVASTGVNGSDFMVILVADAPSGLASGTTITVTFLDAGSSPVAINARAASACSFTGLFTGTTPAQSSSTNSGTTSWTAGTVITTTADALIFGAGMVDGSTPTWTPAGTFTEVHDWAGATDNEAWETVYRVVAATGSYSAGGTGGSGAYCGSQVVFTGPASGGSRPPVRPLVLALQAFRPLWNPFPLLFPIPSIDFPLDTGVVFNDAASGTITLAGSFTESHTHSNTASGTITLSGSFTQSHTHSNSASGTITLSGSRTESQTQSNTASGTITLSGSGVQSFSHSGSASGTVTLSGSFTQSYTHSGTAAGTVTLSGSGVHSATFANTAAGTVTLSGSFTQSYSVSESGTGTITLGGSGSENYQPPGAITYSFVGSSFLVALRRRGLL